MQELPCPKHESATQDKPGADTKDVAGDLSRSCWQKPGDTTNNLIQTGSPLTETSADNHHNALEQKGAGDSAAATKLGFPDTQFDFRSTVADEIGNKPEGPTHKKAEDTRVADKNEAPKSIDAQNPHPDTWKYDDKGNLLEAGNKVKAEYDAQGNLQKVRINDTTFERNGKDVIETYKGNDGQMHTSVQKNVDRFTLKTSDGDFHGPYKSVEFEAGSENSSRSTSAKIWESPEHTAAVDKIWRDSRQRSIDVANSTPEHPHPDTWKLDNNMNVTEAGNKFKAEYDPKTGELMSARLGDDEWKRGPDNTVVHTYKRADGTTASNVLDEVRSFTAKPYTDTDNGLLAGMTVEVGTGKTSSSAHSKPIYENEEHAKWSGSIVNGWLGKDKGK